MELGVCWGDVIDCSWSWMEFIEFLSELGVIPQMDCPDLALLSSVSEMNEWFEEVIEHFTIYCNIDK